ncbi:MULTISPECIES: hypothetical protein [Planktothrix]|uniref:hypothetical protein n=1 Tax=Planktothrix TaxID=54304 RepID=UPI000417D549
MEQFLREEQRDEIYQNYLLAKQNEKEGKLKFSSDIDQLMQFLAIFKGVVSTNINSSDFTLG